jgi:hypothetical protein
MLRRARHLIPALAPALIAGVALAVLAVLAVVRAPTASARARPGQVCAKAGAISNDSRGRRLTCVARIKQKRWELPPSVTSSAPTGSTSSPTSSTRPTAPAATLATTPINGTGIRPTTAALPTTAPVPTGKRCLIFLHGKGGKGYAVRERDGFTDIGPTGNADAPKEWGGNFQWLYATDADYTAALAIVHNATEPQGCGQIVLAGASNGGAMAAKLFCRGETFGGRLIGVFLDDPVPDQVVDGCKPGSVRSLTLVQSDWMDGVVGAGKACPSSWTCQGNVYSLADYAKALGVTKPGRTKEHSSSGDLAPLIASWWR